MARRKNNSAMLNGSQPRYYAHIIGWGMYVPESVLTNEDLEAILDTSDEWIQSRTGIRERHIAGDRETTASMGLKAAKNALEVTDVLPADIDMIIVATCTPDMVFPSTASLIQHKLGAQYAGAFDLSAACSGFVYAMDMASQAIRSGSIRTAIVIGAETMSRVLDWQDRSTSILFGDGAGAVVLQASTEEGGLLSSVLRSDGSRDDLLGIPAMGAPLKEGQKLFKMYMLGSEVFKFATRVIGESIEEALALAGISLNDVSLIIPHQANDRILLAAARSLSLDRQLFMSNLEQYGNTSAASIPIALSEAVQQGRIKKGDHIVLVGFGGGLTWAAAVIKWGVSQPEEQHSSRIVSQRRRANYILVRLRARYNRFKRMLAETFSRVRPDYGRIHRLRRKIDQYDLDK